MLHCCALFQSVNGLKTYIITLHFLLEHVTIWSINNILRPLRPTKKRQETQNRSSSRQLALFCNLLLARCSVGLTQGIKLKLKKLVIPLTDETLKLY